MTTRYYADRTTGAYLGGFDEVLEAPDNSTDTGVAPAYSSQIWNGSAWTGSYIGDLTDNTDGVAFQLLYGNAPWELFALFPLLKFYGNIASSRMGLWSVLKGQSPAWLTQEWINNMEAYCAACDIPLVP